MANEEKISKRKETNGESVANETKLYLESLKEFDKDVVVYLPDSVFSDANALSPKEIQEFLLAQKRGNGRFHISAYVNHRNQTGAEIISLASQYWQVNPKILLTTLQKESSLIAFSTDNGKEFFRRMDKAFGFGWLDSGKVLTFYKGFDLQVFFAARLFRLSNDYFKKSKAKNPNTEIILTVDYNQEIIHAKTGFTVGLYRYTPHVSAQKLFWTLWKQYWE